VILPESEEPELIEKSEVLTLVTAAEAVVRLVPLANLSGTLALMMYCSSNVPVVPVKFEKGDTKLLLFKTRFNRLLISQDKALPVALREFAVALVKMTFEAGPLDGTPYR